VETLALHVGWHSWANRGGTGSGLPESTPAGFCVFLSDPESKICEKPDPDPVSLFHFGSSRSLCGHFLIKNMGKSRLDRCLQPDSEQESHSQIWKIPGSAPGFTNFGKEQTRSLKKYTPATSVGHQRWSRSQSAWVDSGQRLHFRLEQEPESIF